MKSITRAINLTAIIIGIICNLSLIYLAITEAMRQNYAGAVVSIFCCLYSSYYTAKLCVIYRNIKRVKLHSKKVKENNIGTFGYIARDSTGQLYYHEQEPKKES